MNGGRGRLSRRASTLGGWPLMVLPLLPPNSSDRSVCRLARRAAGSMQRLRHQTGWATTRPAPRQLAGGEETGLDDGHSFHKSVCPFLSPQRWPGRQQPRAHTPHPQGLARTGRSGRHFMPGDRASACGVAPGTHAHSLWCAAVSGVWACHSCWGCAHASIGPQCSALFVLGPAYSMFMWLGEC